MNNIKSQRLTGQIQRLLWTRSPRMDSNSTLAPNPDGSSWKGERYRLKQDQFAMDTYNPTYSKSSHCISCSVVPRPQSRVNSWIKALPEHEKDHCPISSGLQEGD